MIYLLDVNVLLAATLPIHPDHDRAFGWLSGKSVAVCPISELGFVRICTDPKVFNLPMDSVRKALSDFITQRQARRIPDDLPALESHPKTSKQVTDAYLVALADKHGFKLATLDKKISHAAVAVLP